MLLNGGKMSENCYKVEVRVQELKDDSYKPLGVRVPIPQIIKLVCHCGCNINTFIVPTVKNAVPRCAECGHHIILN